MKPTMRTVVTAWMPVTMAAELNQLTESLGVSRSETVRMAIRQMLDRIQRQQQDRPQSQSPVFF